LGKGLSMQHRAIIAASKTGTISLTEARRAARLVKTAKTKTIKPPADPLGSSRFFGLHFGPATAEPRTSPTATRKKAAKKVAKSRTRSRKYA